MAMTVGDLLQRAEQVNPKARLTALIPDGGTYRTENLARVHHHNRAPDDVHDEQPVEVFVGDGELTAGELCKTLDKFPSESLARVAIAMPKEHPDDPGHHRILDIITVSFGPDGTVQLQTENWQSVYQQIRMDDHEIGDDLGDRSYAREGEIVRHPDTGEIQEIPRGALRVQHAGREPGQGDPTPQPRPRTRH